MKKIINGKKYDTQTAKFLEEDYCTKGNRSDFYCETLYVKKTGEFFIYGEGNATSPYHRIDNSGMMCHGEKIVPISVEEAKRWVEKHTPEDYEEIFGEVAE